MSCTLTFFRSLYFQGAKFLFVTYITYLTYLASITYSTSYVARPASYVKTNIVIPG